MLQVILGARVLLAMVVAACIGTWGLHVHPVQADNPLPITLVTSFDQRSPHKFSVTIALSALATSAHTSLARSVTRP